MGLKVRTAGRVLPPRLHNNDAQNSPTLHKDVIRWSLDSELKGRLDKS